MDKHEVDPARPAPGHEHHPASRHPPRMLVVFGCGAPQPGGAAV
jgi:hypothetical protein